MIKHITLVAKFKKTSKVDYRCELRGAMVGKTCHFL